MQYEVKGKRAVVCGGSRGIGRAIALGFAQAGGAVSICARGADTLEQTAQRDRGVRQPRMPHLRPGDAEAISAISPMPPPRWAGSTCW